MFSSSFILFTGLICNVAWVPLHYNHSAQVVVTLTGATSVDYYLRNNTLCVAGNSVRLGYSYCYNTTVSYTINTGYGSIDFRAHLVNGTAITGKIYLDLSIASALTTVVPIKQYSWSVLD